MPERVVSGPFAVQTEVIAPWLLSGVCTHLVCVNFQLQLLNVAQLPI